MQKCRICGWTGEAKLLTVREMMFDTRDEFQYFECGKCQCLQIATIPEDLGKYYGNEYYSYEVQQIKESSEEVQPNPTRVLDVGCGGGKFLCDLAEKGYVNLTGCDPFIEEDITYENGVRIFKRSIHEMTGEFDWINLGDSFEHVADPNEVMASIKRLLAPNGVVKIKLPIYPNIAFEMFGTNWYQIDAPRHLFLHSRKSLTYMAEKHGFTIAKVEYDSSVMQFVYSYLYSKEIPFCKITGKTVEQYFPMSELAEMIKTTQIANENEYGDHAQFFLIHKNG